MLDRPALYARTRADQHTRELGFLPTEAYQRAADNGRIILLNENDEPGGFLMLGPPLPVQKVYQTWVEEPLRLIDRGRTLIHDLAADAAARGVERIVLHCACDLEANIFWQRVGFTNTCIREKTGRYSRPANRWELILPRGAALKQYLQDQAPSPQQQRLLDMFGVRARHAAAHTSRFRRTQ